ncbi:MAG: TrmH family RNA methyltransferase [Candidatus Eisenbacteria bacterium]|nr:TrmH family RNA methyltransferase [Candidatus Latescibacterota bacterium]MBD3302238.1 TrmH family RNA methyltransferase [Candidatus Eisenbacteria bacterium]
MSLDRSPLTVRQRDRNGSSATTPRALRIVLDNLRSAFNVGSIFRTAEGAGVERIHLCGITPYPPHPKLRKTARGALDLVPWSHHVDPMEAVEILKESGYRLAALELTDRSVDYRRIPYTPPVALILGHEVAGVTRPVLEAADWVVEIPMRGRKNSLNVATAAGVVLFEILRGWDAQSPGPIA